MDFESESQDCTLLQSLFRDSWVPDDAHNCRNSSESCNLPLSRLSSLFTLRSHDLLAEGIDFHCDWGLVPFVLEADVHSLAEQQVKTLIWLFRSSVNNHQQEKGFFKHPDNCPCDKTLFENDIDKHLNDKKLYAKEWKIICPLVVEYCKRKQSLIWQRYSNVLLNR